MKTRKRIWIISTLYILAGLNLGGLKCLAQKKAFESFYLRSANYPGFNSFWTLKSNHDLENGEGEGVTHDANNWFFTWVKKEDDASKSVGYMFKVPVGTQITDNVLYEPGVKLISMSDYRDLQGYWHWGDPDHYTYKGNEYIVVPMTGKNPPIIGIFRAGDLSLVAYANLSNQKTTGWCAVNPISGILYTSEDFDYLPPGNCDNQNFQDLSPRKLLTYEIPWDIILSAKNYIGKVSLKNSPIPSITFLSENGKLMELYNMQGGEFTPSGELLYISAGGACCFGKGDGQQYSVDGIYAFNTTSWRVEKRSFNHDKDFPLKGVKEYFDYFYPLGCGDDEAASYSPQGLTIWALGGRAPGIDGQLHVLLFKFRKFGSNHQAFEHFTTGIYVDGKNGIDRKLDFGQDVDKELPGADASSFKSFKYAYTYYPAWDGAIIVFKTGGRYDGVGKYTTRIQIKTEGGPAVLK